MRRLLLSMVAVLLLSACGLGGGGQAAQSPSAARTAPDPGLQKFYDQTLDWGRCESGGSSRCAELTVPVDYSDPGGETLKLAVLKSPATEHNPIGPLVVNPGGPGGSGVDYADAATRVVTPELHKAYDIVGFDPRGVGRSRPLKCLDGPETDRLLAADGSPDTPEELATIVQESREFAAKCNEADAKLAANIGSANVAKDMDILRAALDRVSLDYLGFSYGTYLGALYAEQFPSKVGRFVLDGAIDPTLTNATLSQGQAVGFEVALQRFIADCVAKGNCPLGTTVEQARARLDAFLVSVDAQPLRTDDPSRPLTQALALSAIIDPLYQPTAGWPLLKQALTSALAGNGGPLLDIVDLFNKRQADGSYADNSLDALYAVNCIDRADRASEEETAALAQQWSQQAPTFGPYLAYGNLPCTYWADAATGQSHRITAPGTPPIVVVGTEFDPATPFTWSQALASQLSSGVLVEWQGGDGHTAYTNGSACIDTTVDDFLIKGVVPANPTICT